MVLKTLETLGPLHGYGIARRIEQTSGNALLVNYGHSRAVSEAELKSHLEMHIADNVGAGMSNEEARRQALVALGGPRQSSSSTRPTPHAALARSLPHAMQSIDPDVPLYRIMTLEASIHEMN